MKRKKPEVLSSKYVMKTPWWKMRKDTLRFRDGSVAPWYVKEVGNVGRIFCVTKDKKVILVRQYKHGARRVITELPTGLIDKKDKSVKYGTLRELREETGYAALSKDVQKIAVHEVSQTGTEARVHLFFGRNAWKEGEPEDNPHEDGEVALASFSQVLQYVRDGTIDAAGQIAAVYTALDYLGYLKKKK
jgi:ADP-ribose pyrophosphatase